LLVRECDNAFLRMQYSQSNVCCAGIVFKITGQWNLHNSKEFDSTKYLLTKTM